MLKRFFDLSASLFGILLAFPVIGILALLVRMSSPGPILYRGLRVGRGGRPFRIMKFRSMVINAERIGGPSTSDDDPRITAVGRFMRKYKLDELPQLFNVLVGDMSLVGPRPQVPNYVERFSNEERTILELRPGITDWASVWNSDEGAVLAGHPDPDKAYDELIHPTKMKLQLLYARHHSLGVDLKIIFSTFLRLVWKSWTPAEIRDYPKPGTQGPLEVQKDYETVTEVPGVGANAEQLAMMYTRYGWAGRIAEGKDVLEVACGSGIGLGHLAHRANKVVGVDYDPKLAELARRQYAGRIEVREGNAESLPFDDASFDVVLLLEALYYLPNPEAFIRGARRLLRPGGKLLINSANCERRDFNPSPFSTRYFSASEIKEVLERNGFHTEVFAAFPLESHGAGDVVRQMCRNVAVKLRLIPKNMKWKAVVKRLFFGKLKPLPNALGAELPTGESLVPIHGGQPVTNYKVLYVVGTYLAAEQRQAA